MSQGREAAPPANVAEQLSQYLEVVEDHIEEGGVPSSDADEGSPGSGD